jgi:hypothetical protein
MRPLAAFLSKYLDDLDTFGGADVVKVLSRRAPAEQQPAMSSFAIRGQSRNFLQIGLENTANCDLSASLS